VTAKLPLALLHEQSDRLLLPLVARLVNETDRACVAAVAEATATLLGRVCAAGGGAKAAGARERVLKVWLRWSEDIDR